MQESIVLVVWLCEKVCARGVVFVCEYVSGWRLRGACGGPAQTVAVVAGLADRRQASRTLTSRDRSVAAAADCRTRALAT